MLSNLTSRRGFAARMASLFTGVGAVSLFSVTAPASAQAPSGVQKLDYDGKTAGNGFITPMVIHNGTIYISGQGAHSHDSGDFPMDVETHTKRVMENVKTLVERGGGTMDSILQLNVYLADIDFYDAMNSVFKTYFPNGGPARTCVAVASLPGKSLVEINCIAAIVKK
ncbi:MAG TPA: RidA family protein [Candidatus Sulfotelmatobacter sp.]|nr:RidA family protein [Candidatus Sulfotelmatobacter sp.]